MQWMTTKRFDFHCIALGIREEQQKVLFLMHIGREAFSKVETLASPLTELNLMQIVEYNTTRGRL